MRTTLRAGFQAGRATDPGTARGTGSGGTAHPFGEDSGSKLDLSTNLGLGGTEPTRADGRGEDSEICKQLGNSDGINVWGDLAEFLVMGDAIGDHRHAQFVIRTHDPQREGGVR